MGAPAPRKELRVRPAIDEHDLAYRLVQGRRFLEEGHRVQVLCIFRREFADPETRSEAGLQVMARVADGLGDLARVEEAPRLAGRRTMGLAPA